MYKKCYSVGWTVDLDGRCYSGRKRFEADEEAKMVQFIFDLAHKDGISKIWTNIFEEIVF